MANEMVVKAANIDNFVAPIVRIQDKIETLLPATLPIAKMITIIRAAVIKNPNLLRCTQESFLKAVLMAAEYGLPPNTPLGLAYLIPYGNEVQLQPGYRGLVNLARRSKEIDAIEARAVYSFDDFGYKLGLNPILEHTPNTDDNGDRGDLIFVYAIARWKSGANQFEVMSVKEINKIRNGSPARNSGPWTKHFDEMAKKTVVKRLCKMLPMTAEMSEVIALDNAVAMGVQQSEIITESENGTKTISDIGETSGEPAEKEEENLSLDLDEMTAGDPAKHQGYELPEKEHKPVDFSKDDK